MQTSIQITLTEAEFDAKIIDAVAKAFQLHGMAIQQSAKKRVPVNIERACEITGLAKPTIYALAPKGGIPNYRQGKRLYFYEDELLQWIQSGRRQSKAEIEAGAVEAIKPKRNRVANSTAKA